MRTLLHEDHFPAVVAQVRQLSVVGPVKELLARRVRDFALEVRQQVVAVKVNLEIPTVRLVAFKQFFLYVALAGCGQYRR